MKRFTPLILLLFCAPCSAATYYVATDGSNTSPYDTWAKAALLPATAITAGNTDVNGDGPHIMNIAAGTYAGAMAFSDTDWNGGTIVGAGAGQTILTPVTNAHTVNVSSAANMSFSGITFNVGAAAASKCAAYIFDNMTATAFTNCDFASCVDHAQVLVYVAGDAASFTNCRFFPYANTVSLYTISSAGDSAITMSYCLVAPPLWWRASGRIRLAGSGTHTINNCIVSVPNLDAIWVAGGTANINNCVLGPCCGYGGDGFPVRQTAGTVNLTNSLLLANLADADAGFTSGTIATDSGNIKTNGNPRYSTHARTGYLLVAVDDDTNVDFAQTMEGLLAAYGWKGTYCINAATFDLAGDAAAVRAMAAAGTMEIAAHSYSHADLTYDHAVNCSYGGADTGATVTLTAGRVLQFRTNEHNDEFDLDTSTASYDTLGEIVAADQENWTLAKSTTDGQSVLRIFNDTKATSLAAMVATAAPCDLDYDKSAYDAGFYKDELLDPKTWMADTLVNGAGNVTDPQTGATYVCRTVAMPFDALDQEVADITQDCGYTLCRGNIAGLGGVTQAFCYVADANLYAVYAISGADTIKGDGTEDNVRQHARALALGVVEAGLVASIVVHDTDDISVAQWGWILDEWSKFGSELVVTSHQEFADAIMATHADDGDGTWSLAYSNYSDRHLLAGSPAIDTGTPLDPAYMTDYDGLNQLLYGMRPEIGAHAFKEFFPGIVE